MSMAEIAKLAGVSKATVCRVLQESPLVREKTATQVREVIRQVGYVPQPPRGGRRAWSSSSVRAQSNCIAIITLGHDYQTWLTVPVMGAFVAGVTSVAAEFDVNVMLDEMPDPFVPCRLLQNSDIGGAIVMVDTVRISLSDGIKAVQKLTERIPVVWAMGGHIGPVHVDHVTPDNVGIGNMTATYLAEQGCRKVAMVTKTPRWFTTRLRAMSFAHAVDEAGMDMTIYMATNDPRSVRALPGQVQVVSSFAEAAEAIKRDGVPDGLFVPRDYEMGLFYREMVNVGIRPQDLKLISCDNDTRQLSLMNPRPATIDVNVREVARVAVRRLRLRMRNDTDPPQLIQVRPMLIPPPTDAARG